MHRIESFEDFKRGVVTYEFEDGRRICFDEKAVRQFGVQALARDAGLWGRGYDMPKEPVPVFQHGNKVGTVPALFDPMFIKTTNWLYEPRQGDFTRTSAGWSAANNLGPGDFEAIPGFVWSRDSDTHR